jgi:hypothetical protein
LTYKQEYVGPISIRFAAQPPSKKKLKKSERCVDNRYESDSTRGAKEISFVLIPIFFPIFFLFMVFFCWSFFRGIAHLKKFGDA